MYDFCDRLKQLRTTRGVLQKELAYYLHVSSGTISNYENGVHRPDPDTLRLLAEYFNVSADYLLGMTDCPYSVETLNQIIADGYSVGHFLALLNRLSDTAKRHLVYILSLFR